MRSKHLLSIWNKHLHLNVNISLSNDSICMIFDSKIRARFHLSKEYKIIHLAYAYVDKLTIMSLQPKADTKFK